MRDLGSRRLSLRTWTDIVLRRHGGRFATHHIFAFLVFNMGVRLRNRRVSMLSVTRKNFRKMERIVRSMTAERLAAARVELESSGKTTDDGVNELLRSLSLYGHRQPMSREVRLNMRRKIQSLIVGYGVPAIWLGCLNVKQRAARPLALVGVVEVIEMSWFMAGSSHSCLGTPVN